VSDLRSPPPPPTFGGGARACFPNSGWWSSLGLHRLVSGAAGWPFPSIFRSAILMWIFLTRRYYQNILPLHRRFSRNFVVNFHHNNNDLIHLQVSALPGETVNSSFSISSKTRWLDTGLYAIFSPSTNWHTGIRQVGEVSKKVVEHKGVRHFLGS